jgi:hypothetical protein
MGLQIARGMRHLTSNHFVHRDLAARNVLLDCQHVCKIADFGLARGIAASSATEEGIGGSSYDEYYTSQRGQFPLRWTAPEAMVTRRYSTATDVWSFGVVLLEVATGGALPYAGDDNSQVLAKIIAGHRAPQPAGCSRAMYGTMLRCWAAADSERPSFEQLVHSFEQMLTAVPVGDGVSSMTDPTGPDLDGSDAQRVYVPHCGTRTESIYAADGSLRNSSSETEGMYAADGSLRNSSSLCSAIGSLRAADGSLTQSIKGMHGADVNRLPRKRASFSIAAEALLHCAAGEVAATNSSISAPIPLATHGWSGAGAATAAVGGSDVATANAAVYIAVVDAAACGDGIAGAMGGEVDDDVDDDVGGDVDDDVDDDVGGDVDDGVVPGIAVRASSGPLRTTTLSVLEDIVKPSATATGTLPFDSTLATAPSGARSTAPAGSCSDVVSEPHSVYRTATMAKPPDFAEEVLLEQQSARMADAGLTSHTIASAPTNTNGRENTLHRGTFT